MKARVLTLLLAATPAKSKAEPLKLALQHARRPIAAAAATGTLLITSGGRRELAPHRSVDADTVRRVFAARVSRSAREAETDEEAAGTKRTFQLPPSMFEREKPLERARRRVSFRPASFQPHGSGIKVKIPY